MGTRGLIGFRLDNQDKLTYNHMDSYPDYLGVNILNEIKKVSLKALKETVKNIILVDNDVVSPTKKQIEELKKYANLNVSTGSHKDWYCLLRNTQGTLRPYIKRELKYMIESNDFIKDSLFCEWAYIVNLDTNKFEIWEGFQKSPSKKNRYGTKNNNGYYPCRLVKEYNLKKLPTQTQFLKDLKKR